MLIFYFKKHICCMSLAFGLVAESPLGKALNAGITTSRVVGEAEKSWPKRVTEGSEETKTTTHLPVSVKLQGHSAAKIRCWRLVLEGSVGSQASGGYMPLCIHSHS